MRILDWYIFKKFMVTFFFAIIMLTVIAVVIDTSEKTDDFVKSGLPLGQIITHYYYGFVPAIIAMIFPLIVFISVIFFTSKMAGRSEIVAILANGVNFNRMLRPYFIGGLLLASLLWISNQFIIPKANGIYGDFKTRYIDNNSGYRTGSSSVFYLRVDPETFVGIRYYDTTSRSANTFFLQKIKGNKVYYNLRSSHIKWDVVKRNWKLENVVERKINGLKEEVRHIDSMHINLNVQPKDLRRDEYMKDKLVTSDLDEYIRLEELRGSEGLNTLKVERYRRDATPFSVIILTLIGVSISSRKIRGGSGLHLAMGIITAALFVVMDRFSTVFSTKGNLSPLLAAWVPNIVFGVVAYILYRKAPK
jgi:lipopolysaccharide export system permease protein